MNNKVEKANIIIVIISILLLMVIAGAVIYQYCNVNEISLVDIKEEILTKFQK